jgi:hypothetical protein
VHRLYPDQLDKDVPNPWAGVTKKRRTMATKKAATREQVYDFAKKAIELGYGEAAGAGVICFEWLQRPENVLAGFVRWSDYRPAEKPTFLQIEHAKTGAKIWHPLEDNEGNSLYPEAEAILAQVPRRGPAMILRRVPLPRRRKNAPKTLPQRRCSNRTTRWIWRGWYARCGSPPLSPTGSPWTPADMAG